MAGAAALDRASRTFPTARRRLMVKMHSDGCNARHIMQLLEQLPGGEINSHSKIYSQISELRKCGAYDAILSSVSDLTIEDLFAPFQRTDTAVATVKLATILDVSSLNSPSEPKTPAVSFKGTYQVVSYDYARRWADKAGLRGKYQGLDLIKVNSVRAQFNLVPFLLKGAE